MNAVLKRRSTDYTDATFGRNAVLPHEEPQISPISPMAAIGGSCRAGSFPATREKICVIGAI
jgi:hypothetical protein